MSEFHQRRNFNCRDCQKLKKKISPLFLGQMESNNFSLGLPEIVSNLFGVTPFTPSAFFRCVKGSLLILCRPHVPFRGSHAKSSQRKRDINNQVNEYQVNVGWENIDYWKRLQVSVYTRFGSFSGTPGNLQKIQSIRIFPRLQYISYFGVFFFIVSLVP